MIIPNSLNLPIQEVSHSISHGGIFWKVEMKLLQIVCGLCFAYSSVTAWACEQPKLPVIPTKQELTLQQRRQALKDTRNYTKGMADYVACLKAALKHAGGKRASALSRTLLTQRHNTAIREFNMVLAMYVKHIGSIDSLRVGWFVTGRRPACIPGFIHKMKATALNDYTILFELRTGEAYVNVFRSKCPGLRSSREVAYSGLCSSDLITLIDGRHSGSTCMLGLFHELTKEEAAALLGKSSRRPDAGTTTAAPVQPPTEDRAAKTGQQR